MTRLRRGIRGQDIIKQVKIVLEVDGLATVVVHDLGAIINSKREGMGKMVRTGKFLPDFLCAL